MATTRRFLLHVASHDLLPDRYRNRLLRRAGVEIADSALVFSGVRLLGRAPVQIGTGSFVNHDCVLDAAASIRIGARVSLGNRVMLLTSDHETADPEQRGGPRKLSPIDIGDGAWVGAGALVLAGVTVGAGAVVAAGSVVNKDCAPHALYAGVPAKLVRLL